MKKNKFPENFPFDCLSVVTTFYEEFSDVLSLCFTFKGFYNYLKFNNSYCLKNVVFCLYELPDAEISYVYKVVGNLLYKVDNLNGKFPNLMFLESSFNYKCKDKGKIVLPFIGKNEIKGKIHFEFKSFSNLRKISIMFDTGLLLKDLPKLEIAELNLDEKNST